jgi:hypothetical protein
MEEERLQVSLERAPHGWGFTPSCPVHRPGTEREVTVSDENPKNAVVKRTPLRGKTPPAALSLVQAICDAGAQCQDVLNTPSTSAALAVLQAELLSANGSMTSKGNLAQQLRAATKTLDLDMLDVARAVVSYEAAVAALAKGNAVLMSQAGLLTRDPSPPQAALGSVTKLSSKPGKQQGQAILSWPIVAGATSYAIEVNFTSQDAAGPWTALNGGSNHRRVIQAPTPASQFLVRVAAVAGDGTQSAWSSPFLATAR